MASSIVGSQQDNRAGVYGLLIQNMSIYQIRAHYLFYSVIRKLYVGQSLNLSDIQNRSLIQTYISCDLFGKTVFKSEYDKEHASYLYEHIMHGLCRLNLIEAGFVFGSSQHISSFGPPNVSKPGLIFQPAIIGIELFLWINMLSEKTISNTIIDPKAKFTDLVDIEPSNEAFRLPNT